MAWYRCGGGSGKDRPIYKTVKLYQGKIAHSNGQVVEDTNYYYTDYFPIASDVTFDMGLETTSDNYIGLYMYKDDKSYVSNWYWNPTKRYRNMDNLGTYINQGARWFRMSFPADKLNYIMLHDWVNGIMYSTEEVVRITDEEDVPLSTKTITANGTYSAQDDGVLGYSEVAVNVDNIEPSPTLPSEYQRVEYLNIQGGYFEVDLPDTATYEVTFATSESSTTRPQGVFGARMSTTANQAGDWYIRITEHLSDAYFWVRNDIYPTIVEATNLSVDVPVTVVGNAMTKSGAHNFIGAYNPYDTGTYKTAKYEFYGKLYKLTGYQPSLTGTYVLNTVCDFIPCYRKSDDQVGVYDVIADTFYTPTLLTVGGVQGTVTAGPDVNE